MPQFGLPTSATLQRGAWFGAFSAWVTSPHAPFGRCPDGARPGWRRPGPGGHRRVAVEPDLDALRLEQAQGEHRLADQHGERLAPARAAAQQLHRLAGQEAELAEAAQGDRVDLGRRRDDAGDGRPGAVGELVQAQGGKRAHDDGQVANRNDYQL